MCAEGRLRLINSVVQKHMDEENNSKRRCWTFHDICSVWWLHWQVCNSFGEPESWLVGYECCASQWAKYVAGNLWQRSHWSCTRLVKIPYPVDWCFICLLLLRIWILLFNCLLEQLLFLQIHFLSNYCQDFHLYCLVDTIFIFENIRLWGVGFLKALGCVQVRAFWHISADIWSVACCWPVQPRRQTVFSITFFHA